MHTNTPQTEFENCWFLAIYNLHLAQIEPFLRYVREHLNGVAGKTAPQPLPNTCPPTYSALDHHLYFSK